MKKMDGVVGGLELGFFGLALVALVVGLAGSPGWGVLILLLAGCAHAVRAGIEEAGMVRVDGRSRALPILRRGAALTARGAGHGAAAARRGASAAREQVEAARQSRSAR